MIKVVVRTLLDPKIDFVFKKIFGAENNKSVLIDFLNAVMNDKDPIVEVELKNTDMEKEFLDSKFSRLDIKAVTDKKEHINIEIQVKNEYNMIQRTLYYWSRMYSEQIGNGENYNKLQRTICINILGFKYLNNQEYHNVYRLKEVRRNEELTDLMEVHFIELPKFDEELESPGENEKIDGLAKWIEFLREPESNVIRKLELEDKAIKKAKDELYRLSLDDKERERYRIREKIMMDEISALENAEQKGIEHGIEEGEKRKSIEIARNAIKTGLDIKTISTLTGLTVDEVDRLK